MKASKRDFDAIAALIKAKRPTFKDAVDADLFAHELSMLLHKSNPRFDFVRFLHACGCYQ